MFSRLQCFQTRANWRHVDCFPGCIVGYTVRADRYTKGTRLKQQATLAGTDDGPKRKSEERDQERQIPKTPLAHGKITGQRRSTDCHFRHRVRSPGASRPQAAGNGADQDRQHDDAENTYADK